MKRLILFFLIFFCYKSIAQGDAIPLAEVTLIIDAFPPNTPSNEALYLASNLNNWQAQDETYRFTFKDHQYTLKLTLPLQSYIEGKITRGSWKSVENASSGRNIPNRYYQIQNTRELLHLTIEGWADFFSLPPEHTLTGNIKTIENFPMPELSSSRRIWVYLPPDYEKNNKSYPVLYMHDGENLFDNATSGFGEWQIDETLEALFATNKTSGVIVIGIDSHPTQRYNEYSPWDNPEDGPGKGEAYGHFLIDTLKPYVDSHYRTLPDTEHTAIAGSSMGGLISYYIGLKYQNIFSRIGIFSPYFAYALNDSVRFLQDITLLNSTHIYMDVGSKEGNHNEAVSLEYVQNAQLIYNQLLAKSSTPTQIQFVISAGDIHHESAWARRFPDAFLWLFAK